MQLTSSQSRIISSILKPITQDDAELNGGRVFSVPAVAGAGKSLMIVELARRNATQELLFLCQSRNIADRARRTLPGNITVRTFADAALGFLRLAKPKKSALGIVKRHSIQDVLRVGPSGTSEQDARRALAILARFYASASPHPEEGNLPEKADWSNWPGDVKAALQTARAAWFSQLKNEGDLALPMCFDALIKWWSLSHAVSVQCPDLDKQIVAAPIPDKFDVIVVEESQLLSVGLLDFLARQRASIVFFGDGYQALRPGSSRLHHQQHLIYERAETLTLNDSHRFGPSVASICSSLAHKAGAPDRNWVKGLGESAVYDERRRHVWEREGQHYTLLSASPVTLFQEALEATYRGKTVAWIDGIESQPVDLLRDLIVLGMGNEQGYRTDTARHLIKTPSLRNAPSLSSVIERYRERPHHRISQLARWVYHLPEPNLLRIVDGWCKADSARQAHFQRRLNAPLPRDLTLGTVYQAQGHEWPRVALSEDLFPMHLCGHHWFTDKRAVTSAHLAYTAASRAQRGLAVPSMYLAHLQAHGWEVAESTDNIEVDPDSKLGNTQHNSQHTHFGADRLIRLELSPKVRQTLGRVAVKSRATSARESGQTQIKEQIEKDAIRLGKVVGPENLYAALGRRRRK